MIYKIKISIIYKDKKLVRQSRMFNTETSADKWFDEMVAKFRNMPSRVLTDTECYFENTELTIFYEDVNFEED